MRERRIKYQAHYRVMKFSFKKYHMQMFKFAVIEKRKALATAIEFKLNFQIKVKR